MSNGNTQATLNTSSTQETLNRIEDKIKNLQVKTAKTPEEGLNTFDKIRLFAQGASMNLSDEAIAGFQSLFSDKSYEEIVAIERDLLNKAKAKDGSFKYEFGGAMTTGLLSMPFTFGMSLPATTGRMALLAGGSGLVSSIAEKEGDVVERVVDNPIDIAVDTALSTIAGPVLKLGGDLAVGTAKKIGGPIIRAVRGQLGKKVEDEVIRLANDSGLSVDDIIEGVIAGKTIPELNSEIATNIRAIYAKGGKSASILRDSITKRAKETTGDVVKKLQKGLAPDKAEGNILDMVQKSQKELKELESDNYKSVFAQGSNLADAELDNIVLQVVNRYKPARLTNDINTVLKAEGLPVLFKKTDDGIELTGAVNLETGENVYRIIRDQATALFKAGKNTEANAVKNLSLMIKNKLDDVSPDLKATRAKWAEIENASNLFEDGKKLLGKDADPAEIEINAIIAMNNPNLLKSFREGIAQSIRNKISKSPTGKGAFITRLNNPESKERIIIQKIFPENEIDDLIKGVNRAEGSRIAQKTVLGGSPTEPTKERIKRIGTVADASDIAEAIGTGNMFAIGRVIRKFLPESSKDLSQKQLEQVARLVVSEDAQLVSDALTDASKRINLLNLVDQAIDSIKLSSSITAGQTVSTNVDVPSANFGMSAQASENDEDISQFLTNIPMSARMKILNSLDMT